MTKHRLLAVLLIGIVAASSFNQAATAGRGLAVVEKFAELEPKPEPKPEPMPKPMPHPALQTLTAALTRTKAWTET